MHERTDLAEVLERAARSLRAGVGVIVFGDAGSGRTTFLSAARAELSTAVAEGPPIWVADDVHRLSAERAGALATAIVDGRVLALLSADSRHPPHPSLDALWRDGVVQRVDVPPPSASSTLAVVEHVLGGPVSADVVQAFIPHRGGGDLVVLVEAVSQARQDGTLAQVDGQWSLIGSVPVRDGLRRLILSRWGLPAPGPTVEAVFDLLALAPEVAVDTLHKLVRLSQSEADADAPQAGNEADRFALELERLESEGVVDVFDRGDGVRVRLRDAVVELVLPQTMGTLRRTRMASCIVAELGRVPVQELTSSDLLALARSALPIGETVPPAVLAWAARAALQASRPELALQLGQVALDHGGGSEAHLVMAAAESQSGRTATALARLESLREDADLDAAASTEVGRMIQAIREHVRTSTFRWTSSPDRAHSEPRIRHLADGLRLPPHDDVNNDAAPTAVVAAEGYGRSATFAVLQGRVSQAYADLDRAEELLASVDGDRGSLRLRRTTARSFDGHLVESVGDLFLHRDEAAASGHALNLAMASTVLGDMLFLSGRASDAVPELRSALTVVERIGLLDAALWMHAHLACSHALLGQVDAATAAMDVAIGFADGTPERSGAIHQGLGYVDMAHGRPAQAIREFTAAADAARAASNRAFELISLDEVSRAGAAVRTVERVRGLIESMDGVAFTLLARHVEALAGLEVAGADAPGLLQAGLADEFRSLGEEFSAAGLHLHASESYSNAAHLYALIGAERDAASAARHAVDECSRCGIDASPFLRTHSSADLTERERQIAVLAADGLPNREIAATLVLSIRTVETHLLRAYQKLGIRKRSELAAALRLPRTRGHRVPPEPQ